jgi:outer membrane protein assembly factor BamE (lipoprotein component of BamABCDE complex)
MRYRFHLLILIACGTILYVSITVAALGITSTDLRPGIGYPPEQHMITIKEGMTKEKVRSLLGAPHWNGACGGDEWDYKCDFFGGTKFRVYFGPDDRVTDREWWAR